MLRVQQSVRSQDPPQLPINSGAFHHLINHYYSPTMMRGARFLSWAAKLLILLKDLLLIALSWVNPTVHFFCRYLLFLAFA